MGGLFSEALQLLSPSIIEKVNAAEIDDLRHKVSQPGQFAKGSEKIMRNTTKSPSVPFCAH